MPLRGPTCKRGLARIQVKLNSKLGPSMAKLPNLIFNLSMTHPIDQLSLFATLGPTWNSTLVVFQLVSLNLQVGPRSGMIMYV